MIRLYKELRNWDILNKYFEDMNICHIKVGNKERTFCKCGKVYTSVVKKCEICGNENFIEFYIDSWDLRRKYFLHLPLKTRAYTETVGNILNVYSDSLHIDIPSEEIVQFREKITKLCEIGPNEAKAMGYIDDSFNVVNIIKKEYKYYSSYKDIFEKLPSEFHTANNLISLINASNKYIQFSTNPDVVKHPIFYFTMIASPKVSHMLEETQDLDQLLDKLNLPKEFFPYIDRVITELSRIYEHLCPQTFEDYMNLKDEYKKILFREFEQRVLTAYELKVLSTRIYNLQGLTTGDYIEYGRLGESKKVLISKKDLELLPEFLKENLILYGKNTIDNFLERINILRQLKKPIDKNTLNTRNFKTLCIMKNLTEDKGFSKEKIEAFIDWLEVSPLKAASLLKNRRKMTKKQMEEFLKEVGEA